MKVITATEAMVHPRVMATMNSYSLTVERLIKDRDELKSELQSMQDLFMPHGTGPGAMDKMVFESNSLKADAERYRWLRKRVGVDEYNEHGVFLPSGNSRIIPTMTDAAIDAAMKESS